MLGRRFVPYADEEELFSENNTVVGPLNVLTDAEGNWRVFKVSALYELKYNVSKLKQYATKIKQALSSTIADKASVKYKVDFKVDSELKKNPNDPDALLVNVYTIKLGGKETEAISYTAVLMSWGVYSVVPRATHLPLLLEKGRSVVAATVKLTLAKIFNCTITPFCFTKSHILLFSILSCQLEPLQSPKGLTFCFQVPQATTKSKITLTISIQDMLKICDTVAAEEGDDITQQQLVELSYIGLQTHVFLTARLDVSVLDLVEVSHPKANLKISGTVKVKSTEIAGSLLELLNGLLPR